MIGISDISVNFLSARPGTVALTMALLLLLSLALYYRTNPPISRFKRVLLWGLRITAVLALAGALLEPVIHFSRQVERRQRVSILSDISQSMDREELGKTRQQRLDSLKSQPAFRLLENNADLNNWFFGESIEASANQVVADKTALGEVIRQLARNELAAPSDLWLLFSDGNSNSGRRPEEVARGLTVPVYAVDMANDIGEFDVGLDDVDFNPVLFVGQKTEIKVRLNWRGAENQKLLLQLMDHTRMLDEVGYTLSQEDGFGEVSLSYVPSEPGQNLLTVRVPAAESEKSADNNQRTVAVKVLKSRLAVLLVTARPDYEIGFLHRYLLQTEKYDADLIVTGGKAGNLSGAFPARQTDLNRYDLVVLHDPDPSALEARRSVVESFLSEKGGAIWVILGDMYSGSQSHDWFDQLLPFSQTSRQKILYFDFQGEPAESQLFHPAVRLADERSRIREVWATLPPFKSLVPCDQIDPNSVVLAYANSPGNRDQQLPVLGFRRFGPGKLAAMAAAPIWHWGFVNLGFGESDSHYSRFLEGLISWLTIPEDFDPIRIAPESEVFNRGAQLTFNGFAFDQGFRPISGVTGTVRLQGEEPDAQFETDLIGHGEGRLLAEFSSVPPGRYDYTAELLKGGQLLKRSEGNIMVESFSLEEYDQNPDPGTLMAIARLSGGDYFSYRQFDDAIEAMDLSTRIETEKGEIVIWGRLWLLMLFIGALALEWILRKSNHLI